MKTLSHTLAPLALLLLVAGCKVGPTYKAPVIEPTGAFITASDATATELTTWWKGFGDEELSRLVDEAVVANQDLAAAAARLREARELLIIEGADALPTVSANASATRSRVSKDVAGGRSPGLRNPSNLFQGGFDASWEPDVWGRVSRSKEAARADLAAVEEDRRALLVTIIGEVVSNYVDLRTAQEVAAATRRNLQAQTDSLELTRRRVNAGLQSDFDLARIEAQVATTRAGIPPLDQEAAAALHRLSILCGREPAAMASMLSVEGRIPEARTSLGAGTPAEVLRRRPDVRSAERQVAAETARVGIAKADLYPRFLISGNLGLAVNQMADLSTGSSNTWGFGPSVTIPLFNAGELRARVRAQDARVEASLANYRQTMLEALREAETGLSEYRNEIARRTALEEAVAANKRARDLSGKLYEGGLADFLDVLSADQSLLATEASLARSRGQSIRALVSTYKALGGGWESYELKENEGQKAKSGAAPAKE